MVDVEFNESEGAAGPVAYYAAQATQGDSFFIRMAKKLGAKDDRQANKVLLAVGIAFFLASFVVFYLQFREPEIEVLPPDAGMNEFGF